MKDGFCYTEYGSEAGAILGYNSQSLQACKWIPVLFPSDLEGDIDYDGSHCLDALYLTCNLFIGVCRA